MSGIYTFLNWYGQCHCGPKDVTVHIIWACGLCLSLSLLWIFSLFSAITNNSSLSLFRSVCLTLITVSWQVLAHWVVDGTMSASSAWISFEILTHKPHLPPEALLYLSLSVLSALSLSFSYRTLSPTANLAAILPLSPTWSTRLCPVEVCHCPVIKTQTFHLSVSLQWTAAFLTNALNASTSVMERLLLAWTMCILSEAQLGQKCQSGER